MCQFRSSLNVVRSGRCCSVKAHWTLCGAVTTSGGAVMDGRNFTQQMQKLSDEELVEIVSFGEKDSYLPDAIEAARKELVARNLSSAAVSTIVDSLGIRRNRDAQLASQPLSWPARAAFFILPIGTLPIMLLIVVAWSLRLKGYKRKSSEAWKWMGLGIAFWIGLVILIFVLA